MSVSYIHIKTKKEFDELGIYDKKRNAYKDNRVEAVFVEGMFPLMDTVVKVENGYMHLDTTTWTYASFMGKEITKKDYPEYFL